MEKTAKGKVALVTGGSRGIGRGIVRKLAAQGAVVVFNYNRDRISGEELIAEVDAAGGRAEALQADVSSVSDIEDMFATVMANHNRLDILVNNAGVAQYKPIKDFSEAEYDRIFDINVKGVFFCCQEAAKVMSDNGCIINLGSTVTRVMLPSYGAYAATKGAVEQITKVLAKELGHRGIRVNTISPGPVDTELFRSGKSEEQIQFLASQAALGRIGTIEEIADMVGLLVDNRAGWLSGQNILLNGGFAA